MSKRRNIFLIGPMGAGKTSIGRSLARKLGLEFYDSDEVIEEKCGADIPWILDIEGKDGLEKREIKVIADLTSLNGIVLATGGETVTREENRAALVTNGIVIYLRTTLDEQMERTSKSKKRPLSSQDTERRKVLKNLRASHNHLYEELADFMYDTNEAAVTSVVHDIVRDLQQEGYF